MGNAVGLVVLGASLAGTRVSSTTISSARLLLRPACFPLSLKHETERVPTFAKGEAQIFHNGEYEKNAVRREEFRGWVPENGPFEIPNGPCYTFGDPTGVRLVCRCRF